MKHFNENIIRYINNIRLKNKLNITYIVLIIIPIVIMSIFYYQMSSKIVIENAEESSLKVVKNNNSLINLKFNKILESSDAITLDRDLYEIFNKTNKYNYNSLELVSLDKKINSVLFKYFNYSDVYSSHIITSYYNFGSGKIPIPRDYYYNSQLYKIAKNAEGALVWVPTYSFINMYNETELNDSNLEYKYLFSAVKVINNLDPDNIHFEQANISEGKPLLIINFKPALFSEIVENSNKYKDSKYYVFSREGNVIYSTDIYDLTSVKNTKWVQEIVKSKSGKIITEVEGKKSIICFDTMDSTGWISVSVVPISSILEGLVSIRYFIIFLGIGLIIICSICANFISKSITKPIDKLLVAIKRMGQGNFSTKVEVKRNDEIGNLIKKFNEMDSKILNLIEENYIRRIREKEATIMSLNIQLNPHFLYNTLNMINWIAIEKEEKEISKMIVNLSSMLQYTAYNNEEISDFKTDLEWLKKYIFIMQNRFEDKFEVYYDIYKEMDLYKVPKLFLQPFVENTIIHGFENIDSGGILKIKVKVKKSNAYFIIEDNGKGMSQEKIKEVMAKSTKRIGISNVNSRIQLMYGEEYGVYIKSQVNIGTKIIIKLPLKEKT